MTLTVALAVLAGVVLAAVIAHGAWTLRRAHPRRADHETPAARVEPALGGEPTSPDALGDEVVVPDLRPVPALRRAARLDALIDAIAPLALDAPVTGELIAAHLPPSRRAGTKPVHFEGLNAESGEWEQPASGQRYRELQAGVQLASRSGALNEIEYSEFAQKVEAFAEGVGAMADLPDMLDVVARARELDAFAAPHDAQLTALLRASSVAWSVGYVQQCAARQGFVPASVAGRLVLPSAHDGAPPVLALAFDPQAAFADSPEGAALREVSLTLDVPQTPEAEQPFAAWRRAAEALADDMDATVGDDAGRPITPPAFDAIGQEIAVLYRALEARELAAGSAAARRVFS